MPIRVKCGSCKKTLGVKDEHAGKKIKCPVCQNVVPVPAATGQNGTAAPLPGAAAAKKPVPAVKPSPDAKKPAAEAPKSSAEIKKPIPSPPAAPERDGPPAENVEAEALSVFAEDPATKEVDEGPKTIDFRCEWCDEEVHLPIEMGGKQTQCPNQECRRIVKVPMPKIEAKRDWKKMDRRGPAAALVNQPEQLENAWGTQEAVKARQASLAQAGAVELPPKPPIGAAGWIMRGAYILCILGVFGAAAYGILRLRETNEQKDVIAETNKLLRAMNDAVCRAEASRTIGLFQLLSKEGKAPAAQDNFSGAQSFIADVAVPNVNEQLFLSELALSQCEMGCSPIKEIGEDEVIRKLKRPWEDVQSALKPTLLTIQDPECQVIAMRDLTTRLLAKKQEPIAVGLIAFLSPPAGNPAPIVSQKIALDYLRGDEETTKKAKELLDGNDPGEPYLRVGCAEGCARKGELDAAFKLTEKGTPQERLQACLGVAAILIGGGDPTKKDEAAKFVKEGLKLAAGAPQDSPWLLLYLVRLGARSIDPAVGNEGADLKKIADDLPAPFKRRAKLELFLAKCDQAQTAIPPDDLNEIEAFAKDDPSTVALAWFALAQQHARKGQKRAQVQKAAVDHSREDAAIIETIRPMIDVGWYLGTLR